MQQDSGNRVLTEFYETVVLLASHPGSIEVRLADAYFSRIRSMDVGGLPAHAQVQFEWIREQLEKMFPKPGVVDGVDRTAAVLVAQSIILLHFSLKSR